jgi:hypothetical protein
MLRYPVSMLAEALLIRDNPTLIAMRAARIFEGDCCVFCLILSQIKNI